MILWDWGNIIAFIGYTEMREIFYTIGGSKMPRQFRNARRMKHLKVADAMKLPGVSKPALSVWEGGRKSPSIEKLALMADVYEISTDYCWDVSAPIKISIQFGFPLLRCQSYTNSPLVTEIRLAAG